jgi:cytosine/adenosine deaminase-related metal-dependent hydrolase
VSIGFGSDLMGELEDDQLIGLRLQSEPDGILNTLRSATSINADLIGRSELGRLVTGGRGDLVILDGNPFDDPAVLWDARRDRTVVQSGRLVV